MGFFSVNGQYSSGGAPPPNQPPRSFKLYQYKTRLVVPRSVTRSGRFRMAGTVGIAIKAAISTHTRGCSHLSNTGDAITVARHPNKAVKINRRHGNCTYRKMAGTRSQFIWGDIANRKMTNIATQTQRRYRWPRLSPLRKIAIAASTAPTNTAIPRLIPMASSGPAMLAPIPRRSMNCCCQYTECRCRTDAGVIVDDRPGLSGRLALMSLTNTSAGTQKYAAIAAPNAPPII